MADGRVVISVDVDGKDVKVLNGDLDQLQGKSTKASGGIKNMALAMGAVKVASSAFNLLKNSLDGAISRVDTMAKFPKVMSALGFSAEDSKKSIDKLSDGIDGLPTTLDEVVSSVQQMTAITGDLDRSTDTVLALNNAMLASGASSADASRGVQQFNQMMSTGTVDLQSWKTLQETMPLALQKTAEAMGYTGKTAQRDLYSALKEGEVTFDQFTDSLIELGTGTGDLAKLAKENSLGIATSFGNLRNAVTKGLANVIAKFDELTEKLTGKTIAQNIDSLKGIINSTFKAIVDSMDKLLPIFEWFKSNGDLVIGIVSGIVSAFLGFKAVEGVPKIIEGVKTSLSVLKGVFATLTSPIGLVILAIGALIGVFVYLWRTNEDFKNKVIEIWNAISSFLKPIIESIASFISDKWNALLAWWNENQQAIFDKAKSIWDSIVNVIQPIIETVVTFITEKWNAFSEWWGENQQGIFEKISTVWNSIVEFVQPIIQAVSDFIMDVFGIVAEWWSENQQLILDTVITVWNAIRETFSTVLSAIQEIVSLVLGKLKAFWDKWGSDIKTVTQAVWTIVSNLFQGSLKNILSIVTTIINQIKNVFQLAMNIIKGVINVALGIMQGDWSRVLSGIKTIVGGFKDFVVNTFRNLMNLAKSLVSNGINTIKNTFNSLKNIDLFGVGKNIIQGLVNGIRSMVGAVGRAISDVASNIKGKIQGALGIHSPSRWMRDMIGKNMMLGWEVGIDKNAKIPAKAMNDALDVVIPQVKAERILASRVGRQAQSIQNISENTTKTIDQSSRPSIYIGEIINNTDTDIPRVLEQAAWIMSRDGRRLGNA